MSCCCKCSRTTSYELEEFDRDESKSASTMPPLVGQGDEPADHLVSARNSRTNSTAHIAAFEDDDADFNELLTEAENAIEAGILPELILQGSSGSYFVKNLKKENIGVFKPRDEEPYGKRNPKWAKYIQKKCCPCCFGRGCLIPNTGYLSEAGASIVDFRLGLNVVPRTKVIRMASSTFHYGRIKRKAAKAKKNLADRFPAVGKRFHRIGLPLKIGSFQIFVKGYKDAIVWAQDFQDDPLPPEIADEFQLEFERLVILDYVIRNTDRGNDNWLIRYDKEANRHHHSNDSHASGSQDPTLAVDSEAQTYYRPSIPSSEHNQQILRKSEGISLNAFSCGCDIGLPKVEKKTPKIKIAAIDNGLAFPFKHPDEWRAYPFRWAKLPFAKTPFSEETRTKFLPALSNINLIEQICNDLFFIFSLDKHFKKSLYDKQMSVLRGQVLNLANALRDGKSPFDLVQMAPVRVIRGTDKSDKPGGITLQVEQTTVHKKIPRTLKISPANTLMFDGDEYKPEFPNEAPVFSSW